MILCNIDPSLFAIKNLTSKQFSELNRIVKTLSVHRRNLVLHNAATSMTEQYMYHILDELKSTDNKDEDLINLIREMLGRTVHPLLTCTNVEEVNITPDLFQTWVDKKTKKLWLDCLVSSLFHGISSGEVDKAEQENVIATFQSQPPIKNVIITNKDLSDLTTKAQWNLPALTCDIDWSGYIASTLVWPTGLDKDLIELFAYHNLASSLDDIPKRRSVKFTRTCHREIKNERDENFRRSIVEVIACRAYDQLKPDHRDHKINGTIRRVDIHKMNPPARLHYRFEKDDVVFTMYENGDHDRGL